MYQKSIFLSVFAFILFGSMRAQVQKPETFFLYNYVESFTPYHLLVDYAQNMANASEQIIIEEYSRTNEHRPLFTLYFSSKVHLKQIEKWRKNNQVRARLVEGELIDKDISICWLSLGLHGIKAGSTESSIVVMHALADTASREVSNGGKLIIIGSSLSDFTDNEYFSLMRYTDEAEKSAVKESEIKKLLKNGFHDYEDIERSRISDRMPGAIVKTEIDQIHPMGFGQDEFYFSLKTSADRYAL